MSKPKFQAARGMRDILPESEVYWDKVREVVKNTAESFGFRRIDTPSLEDAALFERGSGEATDIVEKEMFTLTTRGKDKLALRPEFTPGIVRAYLQNGMTSLPQPVRLYTLGSLFRYERPQKGRYREHTQADFEIIGEKDPVLDAQLIQVYFTIVKKLGLKDLFAQINSLGCLKCRPNFKKALVNFYKDKKKDICPDCQRRLLKNPLRVLDCKEEKCVVVAEEAPQFIDYLCEDCCRHFKRVLEYLDELEISYILNHRLVRGLDYYTRTVFEIWAEGENRRQAALGGGGRYDGLVKLLGGRDTPAAGFGLGVDRVVDLMQETNVKMAPGEKPFTFLIQLGDLARKKALRLTEDLRQAGIKTSTSFSRNNIKAQLKMADKLEVRFALILGQKEALDESIIIRDMESGSQETVPLLRAIEELKKRMKMRT